MQDHLEIITCLETSIFEARNKHCLFTNEPVKYLH